MKWGLLTYKQKTKLLAIGIIVLFFICYLYAFKKTWVIYNEYSENVTKAEQAVDYITLSPALQSEEKKIAGIIKTHTADTLNSTKETLAFITSFCKQNRLKLTEYLPMQVSENSNFNIATRQISVEGNYKGLLKLLYELENRQSYGRLCSASFKSVEDPYSHKISLICTFYIQNLIPK